MGVPNVVVGVTGPQAGGVATPGQPMRQAPKPVVEKFEDRLHRYVSE